MNSRKLGLSLMIAVSLFFVPPAFAADQQLNADQFKAPSATSAPSNKQSPPEPVKDSTIVTPSISGLQSDALRKQYDAAPNRVPAQPAGENKWVCPRGYSCYFAGGKCGVSPYCSKFYDIALWNDGKRGACYMGTDNDQHGDASCGNLFELVGS